MARKTHTTAGNLTLADLNAEVLRQEELGFQLLSIEGKTDQGTNFNQLTLEDKMPNNGPYSKVLQTPPEPTLNGKTLIYQGNAFVSNNSVYIKILR